MLPATGYEPAVIANLNALSRDSLAGFRVARDSTASRKTIAIDCSKSAFGQVIKETASMATVMSTLRAVVFDALCARRDRGELRRQESTEPLWPRDLIEPL